MSALSGKDPRVYSQIGPPAPAPDDNPNPGRALAPAPIGSRSARSRAPGAHFGLQLRIAQQHLLIIPRLSGSAPPASGMMLEPLSGFWKEAAR